MSLEQLGALITAAAVLITAIAGLIAALTGLVKSWRRTDTQPAPVVGVTAVATTTDDIDMVAYSDMKTRAELAEERAAKAEAQRDYWMRRALGIDEDTQPLT